MTQMRGNGVSEVQAIAVSTAWGGSFWGTQYHPEHTLAVSAALIELRADELVAEGFATARADIVAMAADLRALHADPARRDLAWRYGVAGEILDPLRRTAELGNWLRTVVLPKRLAA